MLKIMSCTKALGLESRFTDTHCESLCSNGPLSCLLHAMPVAAAAWKHPVCVFIDDTHAWCQQTCVLVSLQPLLEATVVSQGGTSACLVLVLTALTLHGSCTTGSICHICVSAMRPYYRAFALVFVWSLVSHIFWRYSVCDVWTVCQALKCQ